MSGKIGKIGIIALILFGTFWFFRIMFEEACAKNKSEIRRHIDNAPTNQNSLMIKAESLTQWLKMELKGEPVKFKLHIMHRTKNASQEEDYVLARSTGFSFYIGTPTKASTNVPAMALILSTGAIGEDEKIYSWHENGVEECFVWARQATVTSTSSNSPNYSIWIAVR